MFIFGFKNKFIVYKNVDQHEILLCMKETNQIGEIFRSPNSGYNFQFYFKRATVIKI
jgi:hypothetical protein